MAQSLVPLSAIAATATAAPGLGVSLKVPSACSIRTISRLPIGTYRGVQIDATATIAISCTDTTTFSIGLNAGSGHGATVTTRKMTGAAGATVLYTLYQDSTCKMNWGDTLGTDTVGGTGTGRNFDHRLIVYGRVAAGQATSLSDPYASPIAASASADEIGTGGVQLVNRRGNARTAHSRAPVVYSDTITATVTY